MGQHVPTVVVIDDSPTSIAHYEKSTEPLAVDLTTFQSPTDALGYLGANGADLVVLDIIMKEMDGLMTLQKVRDMAHHMQTPVVMVTSKDYAQDRAVAKELGADEFLIKPLRSQEIRDLVCRYTRARPKETERRVS